MILQRYYLSSDGRGQSVKLICISLNNKRFSGLLQFNSCVKNSLNFCNVSSLDVIKIPSSALINFSAHLYSLLSAFTFIYRFRELCFIYLVMFWFLYYVSYMFSFLTSEYVTRFSFLNLIPEFNFLLFLCPVSSHFF